MNIKTGHFFDKRLSAVCSKTGCFLFTWRKFSGTILHIFIKTDIDKYSVSLKQNIYHEVLSVLACKIRHLVLSFSCIFCGIIIFTRHHNVSALRKQDVKMLHQSWFTCLFLYPVLALQTSLKKTHVCLNLLNFQSSQKMSVLDKLTLF